MFALPYRWVTQIILTSLNPDSVKELQFRFFYVVVKRGRKVSLESLGSQMYLVQNNPHAKMANCERAMKQRKFGLQVISWPQPDGCHLKDASYKQRKNQILVLYHLTFDIKTLPLTQIYSHLS